jgi:hypothetical protein
MMKIVWGTVLFLTSSLSHAQDVWKPYFENSQLIVEYKYSDCHDEANGIHQQKVLLRFLNLTNAAVDVSFQRKTDYGKGYTTENNQQHLLLPAKGEKEGNCSEKDKSLFIFSKHLNMEGRSLRKFELNNINVTTVK